MSSSTTLAPGRLSRRSFLTRLGVGAVATSCGTVLGATGARAGTNAAAAPVIRTDRFSRMFRLPPFAEPTPRLHAALVELGKPGGLMDAKDALGRGPVDLIVDLELSAGNRNHPTSTAGSTFFGQFVDHDLSFDLSSRLAHSTKPEETRNGRTAALDLDSLYGLGPIGSPHLYDPADSAKLRVESGGLFEDLPRNGAGGALLGDPRNDEHVILAGLHAAFLLFHNNAVEHVRANGAAEEDVFAATRRLTTWHYQWLVLNELLPGFVGRGPVADILAHGGRFYAPAPGEASIPVEFQGAAYRFGHSLVRPSYRANLAGDGGKPFFGLIFDPGQEGKSDPDDLRGGARAPRRFVGWQTFFDFGDGHVKPNKRIDPMLSTPLFNLPMGAIASRDAPSSLAQRTLLRHLTWELPSGQRIAQAMGVPALAPADLAELSDLGQGLERSTPLFYYVLKEAEVVEDGLRLGPVGGRIVAEVLIGVLRSDPESYLSVEPSWRPTLVTPGRERPTGQKRGGRSDFGMTDFLTFAGVDPASRGQ